MIRHAPSIGLGIGLSLRGSGARFSGILDQYAGAAAAYSLRALSSAWLAGDVVEVRRSSDSTTQSFTANEVSNGTLEAFCGVGDGFVSTWYDQSGNGNDATQATTTAQPKIVSAGALVTGGIDFDGADDSLSVVGNPVITANFTGTYSAFSVQDVATSEKGYLYGCASTSNGTSIYAQTTEGLNVLGYVLSNSNLVQFDYISRSTGENLLSSVYNNGDAGLLVNGGGAMVDQGTYDFAAGTGDFIIGNRNGAATAGTLLDGTIKEIIVYNSDQSANRVGIETNINDHYSIY